MLEEVEQAEKDVVLEREEALAEKLAEMKKQLVDLLQLEMSNQAEDLTNYVPSFGREFGPPTDKQLKTLKKLGMLPDEVDNAGKATKLLERLRDEMMD